MTPRRLRSLVAIVFGVMCVSGSAAHPARAQDVLTLRDAMARAQAQTPASRVLAADVDEASARIQSARAPFFPRLDVSEQVQRGDQPVFVFGSLLAQRRFSTANFDIAQLNHPAPLTNTRTALAVQQMLFDGGAARLAVVSGRTSRDIADAERRHQSQALAFQAAEAFVRVLQQQAADRAATAAVAAAQSDLGRVRARRDTGLVTDADVLAVDVHLADMRQRQIATAGELTVAFLQLAEAVGAPLDQRFALVAPPDQPDSTADGGALVREALTRRADHTAASLRVSLADTARRTAQARFLPSVDMEAGWEFNGNSFAAQRSSWLVGGQVRLNLFRGFEDTARMAAARHAVTRATAEREQTDRAIEVDVRSALARVASARARRDAGQAALAQARESQRIVRNRYDNGLASVTDVLRAAEAVLDAEARTTTAATELILQNVALDRAVGRLQ